LQALLLSGQLCCVAAATCAGRCPATLLMLEQLD
jgi:hypothetical protein